MRLSYSLHSGALKTALGSILNKIHFGTRRNVMFFEDISAQYAQLCESSGYEKEMYAIGEEWFYLVYKNLIPRAIMHLPKHILFPMLADIWRGIGSLDSMNILYADNKITVETEKEAVTRIIGKNAFMQGVFAGSFEAVLNKRLVLEDVHQTKRRSTYCYKVDGEMTPFPSKTKEEFMKLNRYTIPKGFSINDAIKSGILTLKENKLYFRGKIISATDSTVYHIAGNRGIMIDKVSDISYDYFSKLIDKKSKTEAKLILLKTLLQTMGWGIITISGDMYANITFDIRYPPYGFQKEKDNWDALSMVILGYLRNIDNTFSITSKTEKYKQVIFRYSTN